MKIFDLKSIFKTVILALQFTILIAIATELGLQARSYFLSKYDRPDFKKSDHLKVLVIGDSVIGDEKNANSLFSQLKSEMSAKLNSKVSFINQSSAANSSGYSNREIDSILSKNIPDVSIVLLGNSDYIILKDQRKNSSLVKGEFNKYFYNLKLVRFFLYLRNRVLNILAKYYGYSDDELENRMRRHIMSPRTKKMAHELEILFRSGEIECIQMAKLAELKTKLSPDSAFEYIHAAEKCAEMLASKEERSISFVALGNSYQTLKLLPKAESYFHTAIQENPNNHIALERYAWLNFEMNNCNKAIEIFENLFLFAETRRRPLMILKECYVKTGAVVRGHAFFKKLANKSSLNKNFINLIAASFEMERPIANFDFDTITKDFDRDYYITKLFYYKKNGLHKEANELFRQRDYFENLYDSEIDIESYQQLLSKLLDTGSVIFSLQYPNQPDEPVLKATGALNDKIVFSSLGSMVEKNLDQHNVLELFEDDFMHLTPLGARLVAKELSQHIFSVLKMEAK